jgi:hypothetical protein
MCNRTFDIRLEVQLYNCTTELHQSGEAADGAAHSCVLVAMLHEPFVGIQLKLWSLSSY